MFEAWLGIALTTIFGIASIVVSIYCWKHNYEKQQEHNKIIDRLNAINVNEDYFFAELKEIIKEADEKEIDISQYFNVDRTNYPDGKLSKNQIFSAIYNMYHNTKDHE